MIPGLALGGPSAASATASSELYSEQQHDKSGLFQMANITVATGRSSISQSASAADGPGASAGGVSPWLLAVGVLALGGFAWLLTRQH